MFYYNFLHIFPFWNVFRFTSVKATDMQRLGFKYNNMICTFVIYKYEDVVWKVPL